MTPARRSVCAGLKEEISRYCRQRCEPAMPGSTMADPFGFDRDPRPAPDKRHDLGRPFVTRRCRRDRRRKLPRWAAPCGWPVAASQWAAMKPIRTRHASQLDISRADFARLAVRGASDGRAYAFDLKLLQEREDAATDLSLRFLQTSC